MLRRCSTPMSWAGATVEATVVGSSSGDAGNTCKTGGSEACGAANSGGRPPSASADGRAALPMRAGVEAGRSTAVPAPEGACSTAAVSGGVGVIAAVVGLA